MPTHQFSLALIPHRVQDSIVEQRAADGYINATAMCKTAGKLIADYTRLKSTKEFLSELESDMGIPISQLIQVLKNGYTGEQGTWVHPQVAIHLAQWLSPKFAVMVSKWVLDWMSGKGRPSKLPYHLERHLLNAHKIPNGYFSVLQEMTNILIGPLEVRGFQLPDNMLPDISMAKMLCAELRAQHGIDTNTLPKYQHTFPDGREVSANLYPNQYLPAFRALVSDKWLTEKAAGYFSKRAPEALPLIDQMLAVGCSVNPAIAVNKPRYRKQA